MIFRFFPLYFKIRYRQLTIAATMMTRISRRSTAKCLDSFNTKNPADAVCIARDLDQKLILKLLVRYQGGDLPFTHHTDVHTNQPSSLARHADVEPLTNTIHWSITETNKNLQHYGRLIRTLERVDFLYSVLTVFARLYENNFNLLSLLQKTFFNDRKLDQLRPLHARLLTSSQSQNKARRDGFAASYSPLCVGSAGCTLPLLFKTSYKTLSNSHSVSVARNQPF
jgi:hypothetical protein